MLSPPSADPTMAKDARTLKSTEHVDDGSAANVASTAPPPLPDTEHDASQDPAELQAVIKSLRAHAEWHIHALATTQVERDQACRERDEEADTVRDLRLRLDDSRKAFMRMQSEGENARKTISDRRRSNTSGLTTPYLLQQGASPPRDKTGEDEAEVRAKRASKRASLAFGPNGTISTSATRNFGRTGHARTGSMTSNGSSAGVIAAEQKLRGLSLVSGPSSSPLITSITSPQPGADEFAPAGLGIQGAPTEARRGHRRTSSSISGASALSPSLRPDSPSLSATSPKLPPTGESGVQAATVAEEDEKADVARRRSRMLGTNVPGLAEGPSSAGLVGLNVERLNAQLASRGAEIDRLRLEMRQVRDQLDQAQEARAASEVCLQALRQYVALLPTQQAPTTTDSAQAGPSEPVALQLPPLPAAATDTLEPGDETSVLPRPTHQPQESWSTKLGFMWRRATTAEPDLTPTPEHSPATSIEPAEQDKQFEPKPDPSPVLTPATGHGRSNSYASFGINFAALGVPSLNRSVSASSEERPETVAEEEPARPRGNHLYPDTRPKEIPAEAAAPVA